MAALAIAGQDGIDIDGYRDYRGVRVIGAWKWLPEYGFGVVTEVDSAEAYAPLRYPIIASWLPLCILLVAAVGLIYSAVRIVKLQPRSASPGNSGSTRWKKRLAKEESAWSIALGTPCCAGRRPSSS